MVDGYPDFTLQIGEYKPFVVGRYGDAYFSESLEGFESQKAPNMPPPHNA